MIDYGVFVIACLIICLILFFIHFLYTYKVLQGIIYTDECSNIEKHIEFYSLRNRIKRNNLFHARDYKDAMFSLCIILIFFVICARVFLFINGDTEIGAFIFILGFIVILSIVFKFEKKHPSYDQYVKDMAILSEDYKRVLRTKDHPMNKDLESAFKENILTVYRSDTNIENLLERFLEDGTFIDFIDFSDPRFDLNDNIRVDLYKNTYQLKKVKGNYHYEMLKNLKAYYYGPPIGANVHLNFINYIMAIISISVILMYFFK